MSSGESSSSGNNSASTNSKSWCFSAIPSEETGISSGYGDKQDLLKGVKGKGGLIASSIDV
jgi:hypothetical protein